MITSAKISRFARLPDAEYLFSKRINIVVGENGCGKSHLLKVLYSILKTQERPVDFSKSFFERAYADKLVDVFRPESLGRLVKRRQGRDRCEISIMMENKARSSKISFASNAKSNVEVIEVPTVSLDRSPVFIPTRELLTFCPWFAYLYQQYRIEFEETWYDTVMLLSAPTLRGAREKTVAKVVSPLEEAIGAKVQLDPKTGRFYLAISGEGRMEVPLVAEGIRKIAMLIRLISTGTLLQSGYLFWDEPEANLNPKLIKVLARCIYNLAEQGTQVFIATHSLYLLREFEIIELEKKKRGSTRFFSLFIEDSNVVVDQSDSIETLKGLIVLEEEIRQSDRYLEIHE